MCVCAPGLMSIAHAAMPNIFAAWRSRMGDIRATLVLTDGTTTCKTHVYESIAFGGQFVWWQREKYAIICAAVGGWGAVKHCIYIHTYRCVPKITAINCAAFGTNASRFAGGRRGGREKNSPGAGWHCHTKHQPYSVPSKVIRQFCPRKIITYTACVPIFSQTEARASSHTKLLLLRTRWRTYLFPHTSWHVTVVRINPCGHWLLAPPRPVSLLCVHIIYICTWWRVRDVLGAHDRTKTNNKSIQLSQNFWQLSFSGAARRVRARSHTSPHYYLWVSVCLRAWMVLYMCPQSLVFTSVVLGVTFDTFLISWPSVVKQNKIGFWINGMWIR